jgi:hypothetical protein
MAIVSTAKPEKTDKGKVMINTPKYRLQNK